MELLQFIQTVILGILILLMIIRLMKDKDVSKRIKEYFAQKEKLDDNPSSQNDLFQKAMNGDEQAIIKWLKNRKINNS